jgi:hypothetical protein
MGSLARYACCGKEMLGWIREKMVIQELALEGGRFFASGSTAIRNDISACSDPCTPSGDYLTAVGNDFWDNAHTFDLSSRGERLGGEPSILVQHAQRTGGSSNG